MEKALGGGGCGGGGLAGSRAEEILVIEWTHEDTCL